MNGSRLLVGLVLFALGACVLTVASGSTAVLAYMGDEPFSAAGLDLRNLRPVHETCAVAWTFLGGVAIVYLYLLARFGPLSAAERRRFACHLVLWVAAGIGIVATLLAGKTSGREYLGYHPAFSAMIFAGWLLFAWNFFSRQKPLLRGQPAHVYMWVAGIAVLVIAYAEGHLYLLDAVSDRPLRDMAIQWKSNGVLVGSFNQIVYGSLMYVSCRMKGDESYARSRTAFALFAVGLLNTFANYGHHTYHLPQSPWIHWIAFSVSMLEVLILAKVFADLVALRKAAPPAADLAVPVAFARSATLWTFLMLALALAISVPPANAMIHGTHVVVAHSMGAMIGIDAMILFAALGYLVRELAGTGHPAIRGKRVRLAVPLVNASLVVFWLALLARGLAAGWMRYAGPSSPDFSRIVQVFPYLFLVSGAVLASAIAWIDGCWAAALAPLLWGSRRTGEVREAVEEPASRPGA
ncbi:MAG: cbb3-type cytochrome c oxidase subunit I [Planctomycetes bacterium]|nr:cbb3-type cytochrome c oxidase subunit I [Planctomycetota bacterium]